MTITQCQSEMRSAFYGGFAGQLVSGLIWLAAAAAGEWLGPQWGIPVLFFGSMGIFPLTQFTLRVLGRPAKVSQENKLWGLGSQTAFTVPINFLLVGAAVLYNPNWFFPAAMIVVGAHYLPFVTLYGMNMFAALAAMLVSAGLAFGLYAPNLFSLGGWVGAAILIVFAFLGRHLVLHENRELI